MSMSMPSFTDTTRIVLADETGWGVAPTASGAYAALALTAETLAPEYRHLHPQSLSGLAETPPVLSNSLAAGEIEGIATPALLKTLLGYTMMADWTRDIEKRSFRFTTDAQGRHAIASPPATLAAGDFIWYDAQSQSQSQSQNAGDDVATGFYPVEKTGTTLYATGFAPNKQLRSFGLQSRSGILAGAGLKSFSLMRNFGASNRWMRFSGMCIERLVLDAAEGSLMTVAASLVGRGMEDNLAAPAGLAAQAGGDVSTPLGVADGFKSLTISDGTTRLDHHDIILTATRLVLERAGLAPRHVLGSTAPGFVNPGRLAVYGHLDMLVGNETLFAWLTAQNALAISLVLHDSTVSGGLAFSMRRVKFTGIESLPRGGDDLLAARLTFTAESADDDGDADSKGHAIRFSMHA